MAPPTPPDSAVEAPASPTPYDQLGPEFIVLAKLVWTNHEDRERLIALIDPASFLAKAHRALFLLIARHADIGISPATLAPLIDEEAPVARPVFERICGVDGSVAMEDDATIDALAKALASHGTVTKFRRSLHAALKLLDGEEGGYDTARGELERQLTSIDVAAISAKPYDDKGDMVRRVYEFRDGTGAEGLTFGLRKIDERVVPVRLGNLVVIGGRPGTGKSTWLRNWVRHWRRQLEEPVAYFSIEMPGDETLPLLACASAGLDAERFARKQFTPAEWDRFSEELERWRDDQAFRLNERSYVTPDWLLRTMKRYRADGITTFVIDHLHRLRYARNSEGEVRHSIAEFSGQLKSFASEYGARVVVGAQYTKGDKHQEPSDNLIRDAGEIIAEADKIFHTWLPLVAGTLYANGEFHPRKLGGGRRVMAADADKKDDVGVDPTRAYIMVGKQRMRSGEGILSFPFNHQTGFIADLEDEEEQRRAS